MRVFAPATLIASALLLGAPAFAQTAPSTDPLPPATDAVPPVVPPVVPDASANLGVDITPPEGYTPVTDWAAVTTDELDGATVMAAGDTNVGSISDVELSADGQVSAVIVDIGGFLGMGAHTVRLTPDEVHIFRNAEADVIAYVNMDEEALRAIPEYTPTSG